MSETDAYSYTVLRYVHDTTTGEFMNVGVALHAPGRHYASAICRSTYGRLSKAFPGINGEHFRSLMRNIQARFEELGEQINTELPFESLEMINDLARRVLVSDDSSLQWSSMGVGRTKDPAGTLEKLFNRLVMQYEDRTIRESRTDDEVWRHFRRALETNQLLHHFAPRKISVADDNIEFEYTWQNGILHCLEPISFDLTTPDNIRDKAHRWLGKMTSVAKSDEHFRMYFLVGAPQDHEMQGAYENALSILRKSAIETQIFAESQADGLSSLLAAEVAHHNGKVHGKRNPRRS